MRKPGSFFKVYRIEILTLTSIYDFKKLCVMFSYLKHEIKN